MKFLFAFFALFSLALCEPAALPAEEAFKEVKKSLVDCISKEEAASAELKNYADDIINQDYTIRLDFAKFKENESDKNIIRQCRRKAFLFSSKERPRPVTMVERPVKTK